uniref:BTB domain-containing protein n=1 Tax=Zea mays TaxID=4577 RepID=A0A804N924_MAIZE
MCEAPRLGNRAGAGDPAAADVDVVTTGGRRRIPAHSSVLASASPVLGSILERRLRKDRESGKPGRSVVRIRGVTDDAAAAFVRLLYAGRCGEDEDDDMEEHAVQVLVLAHAYQVPWLKRACEGAIGARLTADSVVDVLQLAGLCDAPRLHLRCARLLAKEFAAVERTEAWRFLQENDPWQELHVLQRLHEADMETVDMVGPPCRVRARTAYERHDASVLFYVVGASVWAGPSTPNGRANVRISPTSYLSDSVLILHVFIWLGVDKS